MVGSSVGVVDGAAVAVRNGVAVASRVAMVEVGLTVKTAGGAFSSETQAVSASNKASSSVVRFMLLE
jgi:hypothetical protein